MSTMPAGDIRARPTWLVRRLIGRGLLAGAIGGLFSFVVGRVFAEPLLQQAIDYEEGRDAAQEALDRAAGLSAPTAGHEIFSRTVQGNLGIGVGLIAFGIAMGGLYAVTYALCLGRTGAVRPRPLALLVALAGFVTVFLVPFLKYPVNPPAIGHPETLRDRGSLFLTMLVAGVVFAVVAVKAGQVLRGRLGTWNAALITGAGYAVAIGIVMAILPPLGHLSANVQAYGRHASETPLPLRDDAGTIVFPGFPADVLAGFRLYAVAAQVVLWAGIGLVFAPLAQRLLPSESQDSRDCLLTASHLT